MRVRVPLVIPLLLIAGAAGAETYAVGSTLPELALADQHGQTRRLDASVRVVLFSRDMAGGRVIQEALAEDGAALLERHGAVYVTDVSRMPALVRRLIALPRMRKRPYPMLLDEEGAATAGFPSEEGRATLLRLDALRVTEVAYPASPAELREALAAAAPGSVPAPAEDSGLGGNP